MIWSEEVNTFGSPDLRTSYLASLIEDFERILDYKSLFLDKVSVIDVLVPRYVPIEHLDFA